MAPMTLVSSGKEMLPVKALFPLMTRAPAEQVARTGKEMLDSSALVWKVKPPTVVKLGQLMVVKPLLTTARVWLTYCRAPRPRELMLLKLRPLAPTSCGKEAATSPLPFEAKVNMLVMLVNSMSIVVRYLLFAMLIVAAVVRLMPDNVAS